MAVSPSAATHAAINSGSTVTTFSFACGASQTGIYVAVDHFDENHVAITSVTFNGTTSLSQVARGQTPLTPGFDDAEIWFAVSPPNVTANIVVTYTGSGPGRSGGIAAFTTTGQDTGTPHGSTSQTHQASGSSISLSGFTLSAGDILIGSVAWDASGAITGSAHTGSTSLNFSTNSNTEGNGALYTTNTSIQADFSSSITSALCAIVAKATGGSGPVTYNLTVSCSQTQAALLAQSVQLTRSIQQSQAVLLTRSISLVRSIAQSQSVSLIQLVRLTRSLTQSQAATLTALRVFLITVSTTQSQIASVATSMIPFQGVIGQLRLRLFSKHDSDPPNWIDL